MPLDGTAPDNSGSRDGFANLDDDPATGTVAPTANPMFQHVPAVGQSGRATKLPNFLNISSTRVPGPNNDHYDR